MGHETLHFVGNGGSMHIGDHAGKYIVLKSLGSGGEGSVYLAVHSQTHQLRALKELPRASGQEAYREVKALRRMHHKSLPDMIDLWETDDSVILVMEYVRGENLEQILHRKHRLNLRQTMDVGIQIGEALRYLQNRVPPVLHLDIKPSNIICRPDGRLVLVDFGAAWRENPRLHFVRKGTDGYAAPELYDPERLPDVRTDIYALGAVMYHMISGIRYSPVLYKGRVPGCPDALSDVIHRCIATDPQNRYVDSAAFLEDLKKTQYRRRREKSRIKGYAAIWMIGMCLWLALRSADTQLETVVEEEWNYEKLVKEASISGAEESKDLLQRAVFLDPFREDAYMELIRQFSSDGILMEAEDLFVRGLLHTIPFGSTDTYEEMLSSNSLAYGTVCCGLGYLYRFAWEEADAMRIAGGWFEKAVSAAEMEETDGKDIQKDPPIWLASAEIYVRMCGASDASLLERRENPAASAQTNWTDLEKLADEMLQNGEDRQLSNELTAAFWKWLAAEAAADAVYLPRENRREKIATMIQRLECAADKLTAVQDTMIAAQNTGMDSILESISLLQQFAYEA